MAEDFTSLPLLFGIGGLDLKRAIDQIPVQRLSRFTNLVRTEEGSLTGRPGQTTLLTSSLLEPHHSIRRINNVASQVTPGFRIDEFDRIATGSLDVFDRIRFSTVGFDIAAGNPAGNAYTYVVGIGQTVWCGQTTLAQVDAGPYSGDPLYLVPYRPEISGATWVLIGDSVRMRQIRGTDCAVTPIGLPAPVNPDTRFRIDEFAKQADGSLGSRDRIRFNTFGFEVTDVGPGSSGALTQLQPEKTQVVDRCDTAGWTNNAGTGGVPSNAVDAVNFKEGAGSLLLTVNQGAAVTPFYNFWAKVLPLDLSVFSDGSVMTDDDIFHMWIRVNRPDTMIELRIYFVCSAINTSGSPPGLASGTNLNAYMKAFRASDFTPIYEIASSTIPTADTANASLSTLEQLPISPDDRAATLLLRQQNERQRAASLEIGPGRGGWTEFGVTGLPIHRRDFRRIGQDPAFNWSSITGLFVVAQCTTYTGTVPAINLDDIYFRGGQGLDSSLIGMQPYDYRVINYDPRTGYRSNPTSVQGPGFRMDALRRGIRVTPLPYGDTNVRQRFYRRGGTLNNNWYYLGQNTADGAAFDDNFSDLAIVAAGTLEIDNDQPITTVDLGGNTVLAQPLPSIWGPLPPSGIILGCGDPYRAGHLYWSKPGNAGSWPANNNTEVCSPSEELMAGCISGSQAFVFSRQRQFAILPNLVAANTVSAIPTGCKHGLISRWALVSGPGGMYFASDDGIYFTAGGPEQNLTDDILRPIFVGESKNGYLPVDMTEEESLRLELHQNELWFLYKDTSGARRALIYSLSFQFWRAFSFDANPVVCVYSDEGTGASRLLLGGTLGKSYLHLGTSDDGSVISWNMRTGAMDQGLPRNDKLYGDFFLDMNRGAGTIRTQLFLDAETQELPVGYLTTGQGRERYYFGIIDGVLARNISLDLSGEFLDNPPTIYFGGPSFTGQPETTELRVSNWSTEGRLTDKYIKGALFEINTFGVLKQFYIQGDGATVATIDVQADGRQVVEVSFAQFKCRILRLVPVDSTRCTLYQVRWIFDEEPLKLSRWETQPVNHGIPGFQTPAWAIVTLSAAADVTLQIDAFGQGGATVTKTYTIAATGGEKKQVHVPFEASKGVMFKYTFTSSVAFHLYREESLVHVFPWGASEGRDAQPFGNDDLDRVRAMYDAGLTASRPGGGG